VVRRTDPPRRSGPHVKLSAIEDDPESSPRFLILRQAEAGTPVEEICRKPGMSPATFYLDGLLPLCKVVRSQGNAGPPQGLRHLPEDSERLRLLPGCNQQHRSGCLWMRRRPPVSLCSPGERGSKMPLQPEQSAGSHHRWLSLPWVGRPDPTGRGLGSPTIERRASARPK
jgi:hypothetical protein